MANNFISVWAPAFKSALDDLVAVSKPITDTHTTYLWLLDEIGLAVVSNAKNVCRQCDTDIAGIVIKYFTPADNCDIEIFNQKITMFTTYATSFITAYLNSNIVLLIAVLVDYLESDDFMGVVNDRRFIDDNGVDRVTAKDSSNVNNTTGNSKGVISMKSRVVKKNNPVTMATSNLFNSMSEVTAKLEQVQRMLNWDAVDIYDSAADKSVKLAYISGINGVAITYAIIPIMIKGNKYYELAIADISDDAGLKEIRTTKPDNIQGYRDYSVSAIMKTYNGKQLTRSSRKWINQLAVYADGDIVRNGESMNKTRRYKYPDSNYYHTDISVNLETVDGDKTQSMRVSHIVYAAMMGMQIDALKLLTVPHNMLCNFNTDNIAYGNEIMKWRNNGVQWHIDHINNLTHDNSIYNLQLVTAHANYVLREIRNTNCEIAVDDLI